MTDEQQPLDLVPAADEPRGPADEPRGPADEPTTTDEPTLADGSPLIGDSAPAEEGVPVEHDASPDLDHGHGGEHSAAHGPRRVGGTRADRNIVAFGLGMLLCAILIAFLPDLAPSQTTVAPDRLHGRIVAVLPGSLAAPSASVTILDGDRRGDVVTATVESPTGATDLPDYRAGDEVVLAIDAQPDGTFTYSVVDRWRLPILGGLLGAFALVFIALAGWAGLRALTALAITLSVVVRLLIPLLLAGYDPVLLAVGLGIVITIVTLLLTHGLTRAAGAAVAGTAGALVVTAILAAVVAGIAQFSIGQGSEQIAVLDRSLGGSFDLAGLLLAAVILGGLGVLNDVAVTQAVAVEEFSRHDPSLKGRELFRRTMTAGLSHLSASISTLVLAYVGAALPVIVILALQVHRLDLALNDEHIAAEVVRIFVGALGVLSAVPLTAAIATFWVTRSEAARRRGSRRRMATRLVSPTTRVVWLGRLRRLRPNRSDDPPTLDAPTPTGALGRRRSTRPSKPKPTTIQTELLLISPDEPSEVGGPEAEASVPDTPDTTATPPSATPRTTPPPDALESPVAPEPPGSRITD